MKRIHQAQTTLVLAVGIFIGLAAPSAQAVGDPLGMLTPGTLAGNNPATGAPWEHGTPASVSPGGSVTSGSGGSTGCWGTNPGPASDGDYLIPTETCLRSRVIDLTGVAGAELTFAEALDIEAGDTAVVNIIAETTDTIISAAIYTAYDASEIDEANRAGVPAIDLAAGIGQKVRIEWCFTGTAVDYLGWYIDDVKVIETTP